MRADDFTLRCPDSRSSAAPRSVGAVVIGLIGLVIAIAAGVIAYLSWQEAHAANDIASRALGIAEADRADRERERDARAHFEADVSIVGHAPATDGRLVIDGSGGQLRLRVAIRNVGDRASGRGKVEISFAPIVNDSYVRWSDPGGRPLPDVPGRASRIGDSMVLSRSLEPIGQDIIEALHATFMVDVPSQRGQVHDYSLSVAVAADGADPITVALPLLVTGR
jgi:hypothetical protein